MNAREKTHLERPEPPVAEAVKAKLLLRRASLEQDRKTARLWADIYADLLRKHASPS